jgi:ABC-type Zn uptake system ZnuABC Zn-binding protein ZnuA
VLRLEVPTQRIDRSMGDVHPLGNPHYWLDPLNGRIVAKNVGQRLAKLAPEYAEYFDGRTKAFQRELDERMFGRELVSAFGGGKLWALLLKDRLDRALGEGDRSLGGWLGKMNPHAGKRIVTYHRSWSYFANRFDLTVAAELEPKPGIPPSPGHVAHVIEQVRHGNVGALLMEPFYSRKAPDLVASETGVTVVPCANLVGGQPEATDYLSMIDNIVTRVSSVLGDPSRDGSGD